jgi:hypothetical protein
MSNEKDGDYPKGDKFVPSRGKNSKEDLSEAKDGETTTINIRWVTYSIYAAFVESILPPRFL